MWERILIKALPHIWRKVFLKLEDKDLMTRALDACYQNKVIRKTWKSFVSAIINWLEDAIKEAEKAYKW